MISGVLGLVLGRSDGWVNNRECFTVVKLFCMILLWWVKDTLNLLKPIELYSTKSEFLIYESLLRIHLKVRGS